MPKLRLNDTVVRKLSANVGKTVFYRDTEVSGLAIRVTKAGHKAFVFSYSINGRERRMTIGDFPQWSVNAARDKAKHLHRQVSDGNDPLEERQKAAAAPTVMDLWEYFKTKHLPTVSDKHAGEQIKYWEQHILPALGRRKLATLTSNDIDTLHRKISGSTPTLANRVIASVRKALNLAKRLEWVPKNVAEGVKMNTEHPRQRYLSNAELKSVVNALDRMPNQSAANAIRLLILTGARRSEVLSARWDEFDLDAGTWTKPAGKVKIRRETTIPLSEAAVTLLEAVKAEARTDFLFPSRVGGPIKEIKAPWSWLMKETGLKNFRIHDLRHTHASILVSRGQPLEVIGRLLGHTQVQTTARYAHLLDDPLRRALDGVDAAVQGTKPG